MTRLTESAIENFAIQLLEAQGYGYFYAAEDETERSDYSQVLLTARLEAAVRRINPALPSGLLDEAVKAVQRIHSPELVANNEAFHRLLTEGVPVSRQEDGAERGERVWLVDFDHPENNDFVVANQFTVIENHNNKRPDLVLFVNGLPLVVIELKNPADEQATVFSAFRQFETYKWAIPSLFTTNAIVVISDGLSAKAGSLSATYSRFMAWKSIDGKTEASKLMSELEVLIRGMLNRETLLDLVRHFIVFEKGRREDPETKQVTVTTAKKLAAYHQYYAVNAAVASTLRAAGINLGAPTSSSASNPKEYRGWYSRGYLPHLDETGLLQSITFRLADSLPQEKLRQIEELSRSEPEEKRDTQRRTEIERWLDRGIGCCVLRHPELAQVVEDALLHGDGSKYRLLAWCIMPNHVHVLIEPIIPLAEIVKGWKSFTSRWAKKHWNELEAFLDASASSPTHMIADEDIGVPRGAPKASADKFWRLWQRDYWDRYIRDDAHLQSVIDYIHANPVKAGLCSSTSEWRWSSAGLAEKFSSVHSGIAEDPASYDLPAVAAQPEGDRKAGVVWHTQGSGKSLSMVFYTGKIVLAMNNPTVLVITDRNDLDDQLFDTFAASRQLLRQEPVQAENRTHLKELLKVDSGGVVFTTIQKFQPDEGNIYEELSARKNIVVVADEAHRTHYGFSPKTIDDKDADGNIIGKKTVYGFAKYLRDAFPNATYLGFTGTPIERTDKNTAAVFGNYVDIYDIAQAVEDGATVRIYYESRLVKVALSDEGRQLVHDLDDKLDADDLNDSQKAKAKWTKMEALIGNKSRIVTLARDIVDHFEARQTAMDGKAMVVSMSRRIAAELYAEIIKLRPEWHADDLTKGVIKVVMTSASSDGPKIAKHHTNKEQRKILAERMKNPTDPLKLVIVRDMWLTGFDVPNLHTLYIDKPMRGHSLMQAIARVNRVYPGKTGGLVVDYLGIASDLKEALSFYSDSGGRGDPAQTQEEAVALLLEKLEIVSAMFKEAGNFDYEEYFDADTPKKLSMILAAEEYILGLDNGKKRYIDQVIALSQAFAIAMPHDQAIDARDEVGFFQAVKARLVKFEAGDSGNSDEVMETAIRQVIDQALVSEDVVDIFDAAGIKKPDISILSDEFLEELKNHQHKNIAIEVLKKILSDEIKARSKKNIVQSKHLLEMLENAIKRYQNKALTTAEFIVALIDTAKSVTHSDEDARKIGLSEMEYGFYTAVADNESALELMGKEKLRELAIDLFNQVRKNASIDWTRKESVRAKLRVIIKRRLRYYGYPPDMTLLATETVLKQAERVADELTNDASVK